MFIGYTGKKNTTEINTDEGKIVISHFYQVVFTSFPGGFSRPQAVSVQWWIYSKTVALSNPSVFYLSSSMVKLCWAQLYWLVAISQYLLVLEEKVWLSRYQRRPSVQKGAPFTKLPCWTTVILFICYYVKMPSLWSWLDY